EESPPRRRIDARYLTTMLATASPGSVVRAAANWKFSVSRPSMMRLKLHDTHERLWARLRGSARLYRAHARARAHQSQCADVYGICGEHLGSVFVWLCRRRQSAEDVFLRRPGHHRLGLLRSGGWPRGPRQQPGNALRWLL